MGFSSGELKGWDGLYFQARRFQSGHTDFSFFFFFQNTHGGINSNGFIYWMSGTNLQVPCAYPFQPVCSMPDITSRYSLWWKCSLLSWLNGNGPEGHTVQGPGLQSTAGHKASKLNRNRLMANFLVCWRFRWEMNISWYRQWNPSAFPGLGYKKNTCFISKLTHLLCLSLMELMYQGPLTCLSMWVEITPS